MKEYLFESKRLGFRVLDDNDKAFFINLGQDPEVMKYLPAIESEEKLLEKMVSLQEFHRNLGYTFWVVDHKETGDQLGIIGVKPVSFEAFFTPAIEIGWRVAKKFWRQGFAFEAATRCLEFAKEKNIAKEIIAFTSFDNLSSQGVMRKLNMKHIGDFDYPHSEENIKHLAFRIEL